MNLIVSLLYLDAYFSSLPISNVLPYPIVPYVTNFPPSVTADLLSRLFDVLSLSSFLFLWLATTILLKQYRRKSSQIKYFLLMGLPLFYYVYPFQSYLGDPFFPHPLSLGDIQKCSRLDKGRYVAMKM